MPSCWIFNVRDDENGKYSRTGNEIYSHRMRDYFWGLKERTETGRRTANVSSLQEGDNVLFYLAGKDGHCFLGTCVLASGLTKSRIIHEEYLDWEKGVRLKKESIEKWRKPLPIERLRGKVSFVPFGKNYGWNLQGTVKKIDCDEHDIVIREHNARLSPGL